MVAAIVAFRKLGAPFVAVDPELPRARRRQILEHAQPVLLFDRDLDRAQALQEHLAPALAERDIEITLAADAETAVRSSSMSCP